MITELVQRVVDGWAEEQGWADRPSVRLERPAEDAHGDYATPLCMQLARTAKKAPKMLAEELRTRLLADPDVARSVERIDVAGPGFLNFTLSGAAYSEAMAGLLAEGEEIGRGELREHPWVNLEFVSVNPNGPLHVGHGRYAAYGDALHRLMAFAGAKVSTEFYINDYGRQMDRFGRSVAARYAQSFDVDLPVPDDGYQGEYVKDVAATIRAEVGDAYLPALTLVASAAAAGPGASPAGQAAAAGGFGRGRRPERRGRPQRRRRPGRGRGALRLAGRSGGGGSGHLLPQAGLRPHARRDARGARVLRRGVRHLVQRDHAPRGRGARAGRRGPAGQGRGLRRGRSRLAADHLPGRRQGPGAHPGQRPAHLLRRGHRLSREQAGAGLRAPHQHLGRRPPRLRAAHEAPLWRSCPAGRAPSRSSSGSWSTCWNRANSGRCPPGAARW